jgi:hypothetical protein
MITIIGSCSVCYNLFCRVLLIAFQRNKRSAETLEINQLARKFACCLKLSFTNGATAPSGPGPPHYQGFAVTLRHTPHSVGFLLTSDQPDAETSTWQYKIQQTDIHAAGRIRTHNPSKRAVADPRVRPHGYWDRRLRTIQLHVSVYAGDCDGKKENSPRFKMR